MFSKLRRKEMLKIIDDVSDGKPSPRDELGGSQVRSDDRVTRSTMTLKGRWHSNLVSCAVVENLLFVRRRHAEWAYVPSTGKLRDWLGRVRQLMNVELLRMRPYVQEIASATFLTFCRMLLIAPPLVVQCSRQHGMSAPATGKGNIIAVCVRWDLVPISIHNKEIGDLHNPGIKVRLAPRA